MVFESIKRAFSGGDQADSLEEDYIEIDVGNKEGEKENKVHIKLFELKSYEGVNDILSALREGYTIAIINIKFLRKKDPIELKRAISKIKKTCEALEGSIQGFSENTVVVAPSFAEIYKEPIKPKEEKSDFF